MPRGHTALAAPTSRVRLERTYHAAALQPHMRTVADSAICGRDMDNSAQYAAPVAARVQRTYHATTQQPHMRSETDMALFGRDIDHSSTYEAPSVGPSRTPLPVGATVGAKQDAGEQERWKPMVPERRLVYKTRPQKRSMKRLGTDPNGVWRSGDGDMFSFDGAPRPRAVPAATLPNHPSLEEHFAIDSSLVSRPRPAWPGRPDAGGHNVPPAPAHLQKSLRTDDIAGTASRMQFSRLLGSTIRRHFRETNAIDDIPGTRSMPALPPLGEQSDHTTRLLASTEGVHTESRTRKAGQLGPMPPPSTACVCSMRLLHD